MKKFLIKILLGCVIVFVLASILDRIICEGLLKMDDYRFQDYSAMLQGGMSHDVLIAGNSRGKSHFDPYIIDSICKTNSFCIGIGGYPINVQLEKLKLYKEHNKAPRLIIQNVDHMSLEVIDDIRNQHQSEQFFPLIYDPLMRKDLKRLGYGLGEIYIPLYRMFGYQQVIKNGLLEALHLKHYISRPAYKGHRPEEGEWDGTELTRMDIQRVELNAQGKSLFESFLEECKDDSIKVVLVYSPMYIGAMEKIKGLEEVKQYYQEVAKRNDCIYLDYTEDDICKDSANFCVSIHMNPLATREFSRALSEDLKSLEIFQ